MDSESAFPRSIRFTSSELDLIEALALHPNSKWKTFSEFAREAIQDKLKTLKGGNQTLDLAAATRIASRNFRLVNAAQAMDDVIDQADALIKDHQLRGRPASMSLQVIDSVMQAISVIGDPEMKGYWTKKAHDRWSQYK